VAGWEQRACDSIQAGRTREEVGTVYSAFSEATLIDTSKSIPSSAKADGEITLQRTNADQYLAYDSPAHAISTASNAIPTGILRKTAMRPALGKA
jgi:hypothetical protein